MLQKAEIQSKQSLMLKLYHHPMSAASRYIRLLLAEYAQPAEFTEEKPWERRPEFLKLNASGSLPVLIEESGAAVCGGVVAGEFLDETCGAMMRDKRLMPESPQQRAEVRRLVEWYMVKFDEEVVRHLIHERIYKLMMRGEEGGGAPDSSVIRAARANLKHHMKYTNWLAASRYWLSGDKMTHADLAAASAVSVLDYLGEIAWEADPAAKDWYARIKSRPSFRPFLQDKVPGLPPAAHYIDLDF